MAEENDKINPELKDDEIVNVQLPRGEYRRLREMIKRDEETTQLITFVTKTLVVFVSSTISAVTVLLVWWDSIKSFIQGMGK